MAFRFVNVGTLDRRYPRIDEHGFFATHPLSATLGQGRPSDSLSEPGEGLRICKWIEITHPGNDI